MQISASCLKFPTLSLNIKGRSLEGFPLSSDKIHNLLNNTAYHVIMLLSAFLQMWIHAELSYCCLYFTGKKNDRETHPSEFSSINGWDLTHKICILLYCHVHFVSLCDSVPSLKRGWYLPGGTVSQTNSLMFLETRIQQPWEL